MSSVLDALKRMEEEEKQNGSVGFAAGTRPPKKPGWSRLVPFVVVFAAGAGLAGAGFYLALGPGSSVITDKATIEAPAVFRVVAPVVSDITPPGVAPSLPQPAQTAGESSAPSPAPSLGSPEKTETSQGRGFVSSPDSPQPAPSMPDVPGPPLDDIRSLPAADAGAYRLQGVRWSQTPSRRIAVINSQILREGAVVDGARVRSIRREGVVLDMAGVSMFLSFEGR